METDEQLIDKVKQNSEEALLELIKRHEKLVFSIFSRFCKRVYSLNYEELSSHAPVLINDSINNFNPLRNVKFATWVGNMAKYYCLQMNRDYKKKVPLSFIDDYNILDGINSGNKRYHFDENKDLHNYVKSILEQFKDERLKKVAELRFFPDNAKGKSWKEISEDTKMTIPTCVKLFEKARKIVKDKLEHESYIDLV